MPFVSEAQRRYLYRNEPKVAREFEKETPKGKKLPPKKGYLRTSDGMMRLNRKK